LPLRAPRPEDAELAPFPEPETAPPLAMEEIRPFKHSWTVSHELTTDRYETAFRLDGGMNRFVGSGIAYGFTSDDLCSIVEGDPLSAEVRCERSIDLAHGDWRTRIEVTSVATSDRAARRATVTLRAYEGQAQVYARTWEHVVPREVSS